MNKPIITTRLRPFTFNVFAEYSRLALEFNAINLGQGFPDFDAPEFVKEAAVNAIRGGKNQYAPTSGISTLQESIANRYTSRTGKTIIASSEVTITTGCQEALAASCIGLLEPGDEVVILQPCFDTYRPCLAIAGAIPRFVTLRPPNFSLKEEDLRRVFNHKTRAIILNSPHNPTGRVFSYEELQLIASFCIEYDALVISDEVYEDLVFEGVHIPISTLDRMYERTLTLSTVGKSFSATGWKIGWVIAPPDLTAGVRSAHNALTFSAAAPLQYGAAEALKQPESYYSAFLADYRHRRDLLVDGLREVGFKVFAPAGTYFILCDHTPFGFPDDVAFCQHLIREIGVAAIPPRYFYDNHAEEQTLVRFAFCKSSSVLEHAIERLRKLRLRRC